MRLEYFLIECFLIDLRQKFTLQIALSSSKILLRHHEHNWTTLVLLIRSKMSLFSETALIALPDYKLK